MLGLAVSKFGLADDNGTVAPKNAREGGKSESEAVAAESVGDEADKCGAEADESAERGESADGLMALCSRECGLDACEPGSVDTAAVSAATAPVKEGQSQGVERVHQAKNE